MNEVERTALEWANSCLTGVGRSFKKPDQRTMDVFREIRPSREITELIATERSAIAHRADLRPFLRWSCGEIVRDQLFAGFLKETGFVVGMVDVVGWRGTWNGNRKL